jgi:NTE family protein
MSERIAIVMSGGGSKGAFQVGALKRLYEAGIRPQIVCGTSVGALNGAKLAEGTPTVIEELETLWRSLQKNADVLTWSPTFQDLFKSLGRLAHREVNDLDDLQALQGALEQALIRRLAIFIGTGVAAPGIFGALLQVIQLLGLRRRVVDVVQAFAAALGGESLFVTDPLKAKILQYLDVSKVVTSGIELRVTGVDFQTGELVLMDQNHPDLTEAILASSVQPVFMEPRHPLAAARDHQVYDGGVREITPLQAAADLGADHVYMILAGSLKTSQVGPIKGIFPIIMRTIDIFTSEIARNDIHIQQEVNRLAALGRDIEDAIPPTRDADDPVMRGVRTLQERPVLNRQPVKLTVIEPTFDPFDGSLDFDPVKIAQSIAHGYELTGQILGQGTP